MERKDQGCILTATVLGAVASVPGGHEQEVAGGAGEGLLGPDDLWGEPSSKGRRGQELDGEEGGRLGQAPSTSGPVPVLLGAQGTRRSSPGQQLGGRTAWASMSLEV